MNYIHKKNKSYGNRSLNVKKFLMRITFKNSYLKSFISTKHVLLDSLNDIKLAEFENSDNLEGVNDIKIDIYNLGCLLLA